MRNKCFAAIAITPTATISYRGRFGATKSPIISPVTNPALGKNGLMLRNFKNIRSAKTVEPTASKNEVNLEN